jgi:hypothetical protein
MHGRPTGTTLAVECGTWSGLKLTQRDLDSVPDDVWEIIATELSVRWRYAAKPVENSAEPDTGKFTLCEIRHLYRLAPEGRFRH